MIQYRFVVIESYWFMAHGSRLMAQGSYLMPKMGAWCWDVGSGPIADWGRTGTLEPRPLLGMRREPSAMRQER